MRVDLLIPFTARAEYWDFTQTQSDSGEIVDTYFKSADIKVMITENSGQPIAFTRELLKFNGQLRNVTDPHGTPILNTSGNDVYFYLGTPVPQFDVFGNIMGYKQTITKAFNATARTV